MGVTNATVDLTTDELGAVGRGLGLLREVLKAHPAGGLALLKAVGSVEGKLAAAKAVAEARANGLDGFLKRVRALTRRLALGCRKQIPEQAVWDLTRDATRIGPVAFGHPDWRSFMELLSGGPVLRCDEARGGAAKKVGK
jgi:hypothetical protein